MGTVLLGWELGGGLGHVGVLREVARELAGRGLRPVLVLKDLTIGRSLLRDLPFPILQAPHSWEDAPKGFRASTFGDVLAIAGFRGVDRLTLLVNAWQALIDMTGAKAVVAEFAPTLCLAAYGVTPTVVIGHGYWVPPDDTHDFPKIAANFGTVMKTEQMLEVVRNVQRSRGRPVPETLPGAVAGTHRIVYTVDEIDPYQGMRNGTLVAPLRATGPAMEESQEQSFFAYLSAEHPVTPWLLTWLAKAGVQGSAYVRGAPERMLSQARKAGLVMYHEPPPLERMLEQSSVVIHHAGSNTTLAALTAGRPQLVLPQFLEQDLTSRALDRLGVGKRLLGDFGQRQVTDALAALMTPGGHRQRASEFARAVQSRGYRGSLTDIAQQCEAYAA